MEAKHSKSSSKPQSFRRVLPCNKNIFELTRLDHHPNKVEDKCQNPRTNEEAMIIRFFLPSPKVEIATTSNDEAPFVESILSMYFFFTTALTEETRFPNIKTREIHR